MSLFKRRVVKKLSNYLRKRGWVKVARRVRSLCFDESDDRIEISVEALFKLPHGLRKQLPIDDDAFTRISGTAYADCRAYYYYGVCDEVLQAAGSALRWQELIMGPPLVRPTDPEGRAIARGITDGVGDEQNLWKRKLTEHLVNTINFSKYNEQNYYRAFLAAEELDYHLGVEANLKDFFSCFNHNNRHSIKRNVEIIYDIQKSEGISRLPFLKQPIDSKSTPRAGSVFLSFRQRFKQALAIASDSEKIALRFSYGHGFSADSRSVHARVSAEPKLWDEDSISSGLSNASIIAQNLIMRAHSLTDYPTSGMSKQIENVLRSGTNAPRLVEAMQKQLKPGDIVLAHGDLAEIVSGAMSEFGYSSFKVRYLTNPPIPSIKEDEWPAHNIRRVIEGKRVREFMQKGLPRTKAGALAWNKLKRLSDEELHEAIKETFIDLDKEGLLHIIFGLPPK